MAITPYRHHCHNCRHAAKIDYIDDPKTLNQDILGRYTLAVVKGAKPFAPVWMVTDITRLNRINTHNAGRLCPCGNMPR
jgi:hypothetical protein